jgi:hypothetical protein
LTDLTSSFWLAEALALGIELVAVVPAAVVPDVPAVVPAVVVPALLDIDALT